MYDYRTGVLLAQMISAETITGSDHLPGDEDNSQERMRSKKPSVRLSAEYLVMYPGIRNVDAGSHDPQSMCISGHGGLFPDLGMRGHATRHKSIT